jgi:Flp pilus assembly protein TadD
MPLSVRARLAVAGLVASAASAVVLADRPARDPVVQVQVGDLMARDGRHDEALTAYRAAWGAGDGAWRVRAGKGLVRAALRTTEFRRAHATSAELVRLVPDDAEALALDGDALWASGRFDEADARYQESTAIDPQQPRALNGLARSLAGRNQLDAALDLATRAVASPSREPEHLHTLGLINERLGRYDDAVICFTDFLGQLAHRDRTERAVWTEQQIRFLRSFGERQPYAMAPDVRSGVHVVPFRLERNKVVVRGSINGGRDVDLVLDTGAEMTALTRRTAERHHVDPIVTTLSAGVGHIGTRGLLLGRIDTLSIGTLRVSNVPAMIKSPALSGLPTSETDGFSPLDWGLSVRVDYVRRVVTMAREFPELPGEAVLPMRMDRLALVRGTVDQARPVNFVVDTGGEVVSISRSVFNRLDREPVRRIPVRVYGVSGWDREAFVMPGLDVAFEHVSLPNFSVIVLDLDAPSLLLGFDIGGIIGHKFLSKYLVTMDLQRSQLRLAAS